MATQTLAPTGMGAGASTNFTAVVAATIWEAVDDPVSSPNETDYARNASSSGTFRLWFPAFTFTSTAVEKLTFRFWMRTNVASGGITWAGRLRKNSVTYNGTSVPITNTAFAVITIDWLTNPLTGVAWVNAADINSGMTGGVNGFGGSSSGLSGAETLDVAAFEIIATYTPVSAGSPPGSITNLDGTAVSSTQVDLTWTAATDADSHRIERATVIG